MASFSLTVTNTLSLDGRTFDNTGTTTYRANQVITQTRDVDTTYAAIGIGGARLMVVINKGEVECYIRVTLAGPNYYFFPLPPGAHMVLPEYFDTTRILSSSVEARSASGTGRLFIIVGQ